MKLIQRQMKFDLKEENAQLREMLDMNSIKSDVKLSADVIVALHGLMS